MRNPLATLVVFLLTACGGSTKFADAPPCERPVLIPERQITDQDIEVFWGRDRAELLVCGDKVEALSGRTPK